MHVKELKRTIGKLTMAKLYLEQLLTLIEKTNLKTHSDAADVEAKHFFSGAALYKDKKLCASLSPVGIAFKLADDEVAALINSGKAQPLKYFAKGHIKKGYALFAEPDLTQIELWKGYFLKALQHA